MALNASIFGNMLAQPKSPEEYLAERQQLEQGKMANMLNQQKIESYKRDQERQNNLLLMQKRGATADELASAGYYDEASKAYNFSAAKEADQREKAKFTLGVQRDLARRVMAAPSGQSAMAAIDEMERITGQNMDSERQKVAMFQSPDDYRRWAAGHAMTAEQLLPTFGTLNTGGAILDRTVDPVTGKVTVLGSTKVTPTPGQLIQEGNNIRSNARMTQNGAGATPAPAPKTATGTPSAAANQAELVKQFGKAPVGYRWKADGGMEFIPGGPADQKAQQQKSGEGTVGSVVADLRAKYQLLDDENAIVSENNKWGTNIGARIGSSGVGQMFGGAVGTKAQSARDAIAMTRPLLLQSIMKATGMSAKQMDSNAELKMYLATATDPTLGLQANMEALDRIEALYGGGSQPPTANKAAPKPAASTGQPAPKAKPSVSNW